MSRTRPEDGCYDLGFDRSYAVSDSAEVALEDYARVLAQAAAAEVIPAPLAPGILGVHVCGSLRAPGPVLLADLEAFAGDLAARSSEAGPGRE